MFALFFGFGFDAREGEPPKALGWTIAMWL